MATNEVAVAAALWDITDPANESFDLLSGNEVDVWEAFADRIPAMTGITLEDFRAGLALEVTATLLFDTTGDAANLRILNAREILYYADADESNDTPGTASPLTAGLPLTRRTLFGAGDEDWFSLAIPAGILRAETLNLGDGGDTLLELYTTGGTLLASNNNRAPGDLSSLLLVEIAAPTTVHLRILSAGGFVEHGSYDLLAGLAPNIPPAISNLTAFPPTGPVPLKVTFDAMVTDGDGLFLSYGWDLDGDGRVDMESLEGPRVTFTYGLPGTHTATLFVTDGNQLKTSLILT